MSLFLSPFIGSAFALDELFHDYDAPQALAMGNAYTADAKGHAANYYNPAGLAKEFKGRWEVVPVALDMILGFGALGAAVGSRSFSLSRVLEELRNRPGTYAYQRFNLHPAVGRRNVALAFLGSYWLAGRSDGTNADVDAGYDLGPSFGWGFNLAGNVLKLGVSTRAFVRTQLKGNIAHDSVLGDDALKANMREGFGFSFNAGMMLTLPNKYLPTLALVWKDILDTPFYASNMINPTASGPPPETIPQSFHAAFSLHPALGRGLRGTIAVELKHLERTDLDWKKRAHLGLQVEGYRSVYFWAGLNQLYPTAGIGLRVKGGDLEAGTYGQDVGAGNQREESRRIFIRYTIDF